MPKLLNVTTQEVVAAYEELKSTTKVSARFGISQSAVLKRLRSAKVVIGKRGRPEVERKRVGGIPKPKFVGYKSIAAWYWCSLYNRCLKKGWGLNITIESAWELFVRQGGRCAVTNVQLVLVRSSTNGLRGSQTASLDRIDNSKGYEPGNVRWVHKTVNRMLGAMTDAEFVEWCRLTIEHDRNLTRALAERFGELAALNTQDLQLQLAA